MFVGLIGVLVATGAVVLAAAGTSADRGAFGCRVTAEKEIRWAGVPISGLNR